MQKIKHQRQRRQFLHDTFTGLSGIALASLMQRDGLVANEFTEGKPLIDAARPFASRQPHHHAAAENVLVIFCSGACSQIDTFDYKPELIRRHGQAMPGADQLLTFQGEQRMLTKSPWEFKPRGESGKMVSDLLPQLAELADEMCFLHALTSKTNTHGPGENFMSTGYTLDGFPSMGAWLTYALGSENQELPAYVAIPDPRGTPQSSVNNWGPGFLPAAFQGTDFNAASPIRNLKLPRDTQPEQDRKTRDFLKQLNQRHLERFPGDTELAARISSYELAARMQLSVPSVTDLSTETGQTLSMYGADDSENPLKAAFARNCILARRLVEKGVRFVQLYHQGWDHHGNLPGGMRTQCRETDQPSAALLMDLEQRGMLEDTLVIWGGEFGRTNYSQGKITEKSYGRDHHPRCFSMWLAGGGVKGGITHGETCDHGYNIVADPVDVRDLHATIMHLMGIDHERFSVKFQGLDARLTGVEPANVVTGILS